MSTNGAVLSLLLVEADDRYAGILENALSGPDACHDGRPFVLRRVASLAAALRHLAEQPADLVLLSLDLPDGKGLEGVEQLSSHAGSGGVLVLCQEAQRPLALRAVAAGAQYYLLKEGMPPQALRQTVCQALAGQRTLAALRRTEHRYHALFDGMPVGLFQVDRAGTIREANQALAGILGYPQAADLMGRDVAEFLPRPADLALLADWMETGEGVQDIEWRFRRLDGEAVWVQARFRLLRGNGGAVTGLEGALLDTSRRKEAEARLELMSQAVESSATIIVIADQDGLIQYVNRHFTQVTGFTLAEVAGMETARLGVTSAEQEEELWQALRQHGSWQGQFQNRKKSGELYWESAAISAITDETGQVTHFMKVAKDISKQRRNTVALQRRDAVLEAVSLAASQFLQANDWLAHIDQVLGTLGQAVEASRAYIFANHEGEGKVLLTSMRYEWVQDGVEPRAGNPALQSIPYEEAGFGRWLQELSQDRLIAGNVATFPPAECALLQAQQIQSILVVPIFVARQWWGLIGFDDTQAERSWSVAETDALRTAATMMGAAILHQQAEQAEAEQRTLAEALRDTALSLSRTLDLDALLEQVLLSVGRLVAHETASIMLIEGERARIVRHRGFESHGAAQAVDGIQFELSHSDKFRRLVERREPVLIPDTRRDPEWQVVPATAWIRSYLGVPIATGQRVAGVLNLDSSRPNAFTLEDARRLAAFASQVAVALENAHLYQAALEAAERRRALHEASQSMVMGLHEPEKIYQAVHQAVARLFPCDLCLISVMEEESGQLVPVYLVQEGQRTYDPPAPFAGNLADQVMESNRTLRLQLPAGEEPPGIVAAGPAASPDYQGVSLMASPVHVNGRHLGVIFVQTYRQHAYTEEDERALEMLASLVAAALENARLLQATERRNMELLVLEQVSAAARHALNRAELLPAVLEQLMGLLGAGGAFAAMVDEATQAFVCEAAAGGWEHLTGVQLPLDAGITGRVLHTAQLYSAADITADPELLYPTLVEALPAVAAAPLLVEEKPMGVLWIGRTHPFQPHEVDLLAAVADIAVNAIWRATLYDQSLAYAEQLELRVAERTAELHQANTRLQELDRMKSNFVSDVSHELRTPISNLYMYLDLLSTGKPERRDQYLEVLRREARRLGSLVEEILDLSRLEMAQGRPLRFGPVDFNEIVRQVVAAHQPRAEAAGLMLIHDLQPDLPPLLGEPNQLAQVVTNLVANAINYTPDGYVQVRTYPNGSGTAYLEVEDSGTGIFPDDLPHLFERFYRGQTAGQSNVPGSGLGLAIVKEIVDLHQGEIQVESTLGEGSRFLVKLPVA